VNRQLIIDRVLKECECADTFAKLVDNSYFFTAGRSVLKPNGFNPNRAVRRLFVATGFTKSDSPIYIGVRMARCARNADGRALEAILRDCLGGDYANEEIWYGADTEDLAINWWPLYKNFEVPGTGASDSEITKFVEHVCRELCALIKALQRCGSH